MPAARVVLLCLLLTGPRLLAQTGDTVPSPVERRETARAARREQQRAPVPQPGELPIDQLLWEIDHQLENSILFAADFLQEPDSDVPAASDVPGVPDVPEPQLTAPQSGSANVTSPPPLNDDTAEDYSGLRAIPGNPSNSGFHTYKVGYDNGFVVRPVDPDDSPFELKIRTQNQIRYTGFARDVATWTDGTGAVLPVSNASNFEIPRGRLIFSGFVFRRELSYNLNIDYNTVSNSQINFRAYWLAWRFSRAVTIYAGQSKVPGSREWLMSVMQTQGADRSMATTFFRPSLSQGIWFTGEPVDGLYYHAMMANGFNTLGNTTRQLNSKMTFSGSLWWEPWGSFGPGYSDFEWHDDPAVRLGTSLTWAPEQGPQGSPDAPENSDVRLSNGTIITATGALAPGTTLNLYQIGLATFDLSYKHRGFSLSSEGYLQSIFGLGANAPLPESSIFQYGGFVQGGAFVIPQKLEFYGRTSCATSTFGTGTEYAGGANWFFLPDVQNLRYTLDVAWLNHNPADQNRTNLQAGQTGLLIRSQIQIFF